MTDVEIREFDGTELVGPVLKAFLWILGAALLAVVTAPVWLLTATMLTIVGSGHY